MKEKRDESALIVHAYEGLVMGCFRDYCHRRLARANNTTSHNP